ncbi:hypothetical protein LEP1GSC061_1357 [Leptospira wolffii serovar Khorat str. Khorat-H2]|nr:hypothetical protein LEP1GSC061_1357 [Leptospira wolffii serovar Khorat str. Khorat-H2]
MILEFSRGSSASQARHKRGSRHSFSQRFPKSVFGGKLRKRVSLIDEG